MPRIEWHHNSGNFRSFYKSCSHIIEMPSTKEEPTSKDLDLIVVEKRYDFPDDTVFLHPKNYKLVQDVSFVFLKGESGQREFLAVGKSGVLIPVGSVQTVALSERMRKTLGVRIGDTVRCEGVPAAEKVSVRPLAHTLEGYTGDLRLDFPFECIEKQLNLPKIITKGVPFVVESGHRKVEFEVVDVDHSSSEHFWWSSAAEVDYQVEKKVDSEKGKEEREEDGGGGVASVVALWNAKRMGLILPKGAVPVPIADRRATLCSIGEESGVDSESDDIQFAECAECPVCFNEYDDDPEFKPMVLLCGHSLCAGCLQKSSKCPSCEFPIVETAFPNGVSQKGSVGYDILRANRALREMKTSECRKEASRSMNNEDAMRCGGCKLMEKTAKMRLCESCLDKHELNKNMDEQLLTSCLICTTCVVDEHLGHKFIKYIPWKTQEMCRLTSENAVESFIGMKQLCQHEERTGMKQCEKWMQEMKAYADFDTSSLSMADATLLDKFLSDKVHKVNESADGTLFPLRRFKKVVKDSAELLQRVREDGIAGRF